MEEIEVGEYVRTKDGIIAKITYVDSLMIDCDRDVFDLENLAMMEIPIEYAKEYIVKHSKNIIDLIEEGDYVNGCQVMGIYVPRDTWEPIQINVDSQTIKYFIQDEIKSIVTKEKFNSIAYRLEE